VTLFSGRLVVNRGFSTVSEGVSGVSARDGRATGVSIVTLGCDCGLGGRLPTETER